MMSMVPFADLLKENEFRLKVKLSWRILKEMLGVMKGASELAVKYYNASVIGWCI